MAAFRRPSRASSNSCRPDGCGPPAEDSPLRPACFRQRLSTAHASFETPIPTNLSDGRPRPLQL
ncbi:hypothetical protein GCM10019071_06460 [Sphingobium fuliginis]|uniref:Uncharacterized protein n=1 Tax=Sphingobium fuliginis (strain ATCC 27551) TaxID=336203 RepID=A0ABQ1EPL0_SPHSA|nr:hypothetical protein GCM10019071_06460 [Sphingobium fuliginis]